MPLFAAWWRPSSLERDFFDLELGGGDDLLPRSFLEWGDECDRLASLRCSTRSTNSVDIGFDLVGDVIINNAVDCLDVQPSSCDVGRDQGCNLLRFESLEYFEPSLLVMIAMERSSWIPSTPKGAVELDHRPAGIAKDDACFTWSAVEKLEKKSFLVVFSDSGESLLNVGYGGESFGRRYGFWTMHESLHQRTDFGRDRRRKEESLSIARGTFQNRGDFIDEAHVEHSIRFVQDDMAGIAETQDPLLEEIEDSARGSDSEVCSPPKGKNLSRLMHTTHQQGGPNSSSLSQLRSDFFNLLSELSGWAQDQSLDRDPFRVELTHHGRGKSEGFSRSGFRFPDEIPTLDDDRDRSFLDGRGRDKAELVETCEDSLR